MLITDYDDARIYILGMLDYLIYLCVISNVIAVCYIDNLCLKIISIPA